MRSGGPKGLPWSLTATRAGARFVQCCPSSPAPGRSHSTFCRFFHPMPRAERTSCRREGGRKVLWSAGCADQGTARAAVICQHWTAGRTRESRIRKPGGLPPSWAIRRPEGKKAQAKPQGWRSGQEEAGLQRRPSTATELGGLLGKAFQATGGACRAAGTSAATSTVREGRD